jgi:hypothetical protein
MLNRTDIKYFKLAVGESNIGKSTSVDISARCPICGDSKRGNKYRLHLYNKGEVTNVSCFNGDCSCVNKTVFSFLRDFYPNLLPQYKKETFGDKINSLKSQKLDIKKEIKQEVTHHDLTPYFQDINPESIQYLKNRGIEYNLNYGKWYYGYQDLKIGEKTYPICGNIIIPLYDNNKMYGFYSRSITKKDFITYMPEANIGYKIWNWFNIDKSKPVYIFEGIFDAISSGLPNVIAAIGAKIPQERINELKEPVFVLDNDKTGILNMIEMAKRGHKVFVQPKEIRQKDMNEVKLNNDIMISKLITDNVYSGISAITRLKAKL